MGRFALIIIILGGVLGYYGFREFQLGSGASADPQDITATALAENGPGENAHIKLTDVIMLGNVVYEEKGGKWTKVYVPAVASSTPVDDMGEPITDTFNIIVKSSKYSSPDALQTLFGKEIVQGVVINKIEGLGKEEKKLISSSYPNVDVEKVWIVEEGRKPTSASISMGMMGGGALLIVLALVGLIRSSRGGDKKA